MFSLRKKAEDDEEEEETASPSSVCLDGSCRRFSEVQGLPYFSTAARQREDATACCPSSLQLEFFNGVVTQTDTCV